MTIQKENPGWATGAIKEDLSRGSTTRIADAADNIPFDAQLLANNPQARAVDWNAYQRGYLDGHAAAQISQEEQAQKAVRLFQAAQEDEETIRRDMAHTRDFFDVARRRNEQRADVRGDAA